MDINDVNTDTISTSTDALVELADMLTESSEISASQLSVYTERGELRITGNPDGGVTVSLAEPDDN